MSQRLTLQDADGVFLELPGRGILLAAGDTVPTDGDLGYSTGCIFIQLDGTTLDNTLFTNIGDKDSANFDAQVNS